MLVFLMQCKLCEKEHVPNAPISLFFFLSFAGMIFDSLLLLQIKTICSSANIYLRMHQTITPFAELQNFNCTSS